MSNPITEEIQKNVRDLIAQITNFEPGTERFTNLEKCVLNTLKKSDTMYFLTTKDIKKMIWSMGDKFMFHGFFKHAEYLKLSHDKYIDKNLPQSDLTPHLNVVKFLLCMSQNPTNFFWKNPEKFDFIYENPHSEPVEDWGAYLTKDIERWSPSKEDSFQENSESDEETLVGVVSKNEGSLAVKMIPERHNFEEYHFRDCRNKLLGEIQNEWYSGGTICMEPPSEWFDARVGILWEKHLQKSVQNLIKIDPISVISEYKVMREVLWQMWGPHSSTIFELKFNKLVAKPNVTISSVCSMTFEVFLGVFVPYIDILDEFRQFFKRLEVENSAETYKSYGNAIKKIMKSVFFELIQLEEEIRVQESTMTLLKMAEKFEKIFEPIHVLKKIHSDVILEDFFNYTKLECALTLLTRLRQTLQFSVNKLEQDMRLSLYLESLFYYFAMTNAWLVKNDLYDHSEEFIILNKNLKNRCENANMNFFLQENVEDFSEKDGIIRIISEQVLQIGRNIHLLRLLGKYDVFSKGGASIHDEFIGKLLQELSDYYGCVKNEKEEIQVKKVVSNFDLYEMGDWTSFVDLSDGFLARAFDDFYAEKIDAEKEEETLFEKIDKITTNLFPLQNLPEKIFGQILKERFTISGLMVKNLLIESYNLDKQFDFLNHIFLFWDDLIFPFYRRVFEKMNSPNGNWGNSVWLTSHLQDIIMDLYPHFSENCSVQIKEFWKQCRDSLEACNMINFNYEIKWPLSIIITEEQILMYKELFQFILRIKWALYAINHLSFTDLEPKGRSQKRRVPKSTIQRLKYLRFNLINILNTVQHYLFGFIFTKYRIQFELDFERSNDLKSLISSHEDYIKSIYRSVVEIREKESDENGFNSLLKCVKMLKVMWNESNYATSENLEHCYKIYKESFEVVNAIVNPVMILD